MMKLVLLLAILPVLALSCGYGLSTWLDGRCFNLIDFSSVPYDTAFDRCARNDARLPAIKSQEENDQIFASLKKHDAFADFSFWLSLSCDGSKFVWADGTEAEYTNFAANHTCNESTKDRLYYVDKHRLWHEAEDFSLIYYYAVNYIVCEGLHRSSSPCDSYEGLDAMDTCYKLVRDGMTWVQAEEGGHIRADIWQSSMIKRGESGNFTWADGTDIDYNNFVPGFPKDYNGPCVTMQTGFAPGKWMNNDCYSTRLPYVCTKPAYVAPNPQPAGCPEKTQYAPGDEIFSPGYPLAPGVSECQYDLVEREQNKIAAIETDFFESNSCCDSLTIYDGLVGSNILQTVTGYLERPVTVSAVSNAMRLVWNSTSGAQVRGFHAKML